MVDGIQAYNTIKVNFIFVAVPRLIIIFIYFIYFHQREFSITFITPLSLSIHFLVEKVNLVKFLNLSVAFHANEIWAIINFH